MVTKYTNKRFAKKRNKGSVLVLAVVVVFALMILGFGILTAAYGARRRAANLRDQAMSELAAEAGYEAAIRWMHQQADVLSGVKKGGRVRGRGRGTGTETTRMIRENSLLGGFGRGGFNYTISFDRFLGTQPVYKIVSEGYYGLFKKRIQSHVVQAVGGWDMGLCEIPSGMWGSRRAWFTGEDIIEMPIHINCEGAPEDDIVDIDVWKRDKPKFNYHVSMGESRYTWWGHSKDKYSSLIDLFEKGIYFDQPQCNVTDPESAGANTSAAAKVARFKSSTSGTFDFSGANAPLADSAVELVSGDWSLEPAVQLQFYVDGLGAGMVRVTNNCTVCCTEGAGNDYILASGQVNPYTLYPIYGYHYADSSASIDYPITSTYVRQKVSSPMGGMASAASGGQIFVNGNVIIGGAVGIDADGNMVMAGTRLYSKLKGRLMVVATGNIWVVHPVLYAGPQEPAEYEGGNLIKLVPAMENENVLGLFSQFGAVKVIDPQLSSNVPRYSGNPNLPEVYTNAGGSVLTYQPVGFRAALPSSKWERQLVDPYSSQTAASVVVQAAITSCGGGWGAENVSSTTGLGARRNVNPNGKDILIVAGSITESVQGIVAEGSNGFRRCYYFDERLLTGILPGDMWLQSKYVPIPGGWSDSRL
ncbi:MAG: hypothetical protein DRP65_02820 [Planctomycetota bacterium]|nr:MAG: hypothetical protein DRP65_02820 [Planctomycetota bacterium]